MLFREGYEDDFKSELDEITHQIEQLALTHRHQDRFLDLEGKEQKARLKLRELRSSSEDTWMNIRPKLEKFYDDLNTSITSFH